VGKELVAVEPGEEGLPDDDAPSGTTGPDGSFTVSGLTEEVYELAYDPGWDDEVRVLAGARRVATGTTGLRVVATEGISITGVVVDEAGVPVPGVEVEADPSTYGRVQHDVTDDEGRFTIGRLFPDREYVLELESDGYRDLEVEIGRPGEKSVRIVLVEALDVTGTVRDARGRPLAYAWLTFRPVVGEPVRELTGGRGDFRVKDLPPGVYRVTAEVREDDDASVETYDLGEVEAGRSDVVLTAR
jgi:hypothetical protein